MARFKVYDSAVNAIDSLGNALLTSPYEWNNEATGYRTWASATSVLDAVHTFPIRCFSGAGAVSLIGWEFMADRLPQDSTIVAMRWWQEFFNDRPSLDAPPLRRDWPGISPTTPWAQELVATYGGSATGDMGIVTMQPAQRQLNLRKRRGDNECLYVPLSVHALWARLAIFVSLASCTDLDETSDFHLQVFAHVGGHDEKLYGQEQGQNVYVYNAFKK